MTHPTDTPAAVTAALEHAAASWRMFTDEKGYNTPITTWETTTTPDGSPLVSGELAGRGAAWALRRFAADFHLRLPHRGDVRPQSDLTQPGRTVLAWRYGGVWVELWHPEGADAPVEPVPAAPAPPVVVPGPVATQAARRLVLLRRRSGRLPFTRKPPTTSPKETSNR